MDFLPVSKSSKNSVTKDLLATYPRGENPALQPFSNIWGYRVAGMQVRCRDYKLRIWIEQDEIRIVSLGDRALTVIDAGESSGFAAHPASEVIDGKPTFLAASPYDGKGNGEAGYSAPGGLKVSGLEMLP